MTWTITFYNEKVEAETLALPAGILANFLRIAELIQEFGPDLGRPHTAPLGKGFIRNPGQGSRRHFPVGILRRQKQGNRDSANGDQEGQ